MNKPDMTLLQAISVILDTLVGSGMPANNSRNDAPSGVSQAISFGESEGGNGQPGERGVTPGAYSRSSPPLSSPVGFTQLGGIDAISRRDIVNRGAGNSCSFASAPSRMSSMNATLGIPQLTSERKMGTYPKDLFPNVDAFWQFNSQLRMDNELPSILDVDRYSSQNGQQ